MMSVRLIFTDSLLRWSILPGHPGEEGIREHEEERKCDADEGDRIEQRRDDEHAREQRRPELGLARHALEEPAPENAEADGRAERAGTEDDAARDRGHGLDKCDIVHSTLLRNVNGGARVGILARQWRS